MFFKDSMQTQVILIREDGTIFIYDFHVSGNSPEILETILEERPDRASFVRAIFIYTSPASGRASFAHMAIKGETEEEPDQEGAGLNQLPFVTIERRKTRIGRTGHHQILLTSPSNEASERLMQEIKALVYR